MLREAMQEVDLLILGAGWTSNFLIPQLQKEGIRWAATTTSGRDNTIPFKFDPDSGSVEPYKHLPSARTVLVTFPLKGHGQSKTIIGLYRAAHGAKNNWIQLGATSIFNQLPDDWSDDNSPYDKEDARAIAEDELMGYHDWQRARTMSRSGVQYTSCTVKTSRVQSLRRTVNLHLERGGLYQT
jgi:hypothetical protein